MYQSCNEHRTEAVVEIAIPIVAIESEQTGMRLIRKPSATIEERIVQPREVRVIQLNP